jgi:YggT family protein
LIYTTSLTGSILYLLVRIIQIYNLLILARVIASWVIRDPGNPIFHFLYNITEPVLGPIRSLMPAMGLDLSPIIAYFVLNFISRIIASLI